MIRRLPDSAFADPKTRRFVIIDKPHIISALQAVMWQYSFMKLTDERIEYLVDVHDCILKRAKSLNLNLKHNCGLCKEGRVKVQFT